MKLAPAAHIAKIINSCLAAKSMDRNAVSLRHGLQIRASRGA